MAGAFCSNQRSKAGLFQHNVAVKPWPMRLQSGSEILLGDKYCASVKTRILQVELNQITLE